MAAKTPVAQGGTNWLDPAGSTYDRVSDAVVPNTVPNRRTYYFSDIDDGDTWTPTNLSIASNCYFLPTTGTDAVSVTFSSGAFTFQTDAANKAGYLVFEGPL